jgi:2-polyprenyl-6-methoxyphenol hydroxylase-like FAD-dependent oxidoreductase
MKVIIAGGGIGGITTAQMLHQRGIECEVFEQVDELKEIGVGITLQTHSVKQLASIGLLDAMEAAAISSKHLHFYTRRGQRVWDEPRGLSAGYDIPQYFVHRGRLQGLLYQALRARLPASAIHLDRRLVDFTQGERGVEASFCDRNGVLTKAHGDLLIGADGIHSLVRSKLYPEQGLPRWSGLMLWRGATEWPDFHDGASVMILGGVDAKFVVYPIAEGATPGHKLTNWAAISRVAPDGSPLPSRQNWSQEGLRAQLTPLLDRFHSDVVDIKALVSATETFWEYPMCDREPVSAWSFGGVTLLGDAAHPMYPMGANGASQAIIDARSLADALSGSPDIETALSVYQAERLPLTSAIVVSNRKGGPESVIDAVEARAPQGFDDIEKVMSRQERMAIMQSYAQSAGFSRAQVVASGARRNEG